MVIIYKCEKNVGNRECFYLIRENIRASLVEPWFVVS